MLELKIVFAILLQAIVLIPACLCHAWTEPTYPSIKPVAMGSNARPLVDEWSWKWLNYWYANSEDGVSGQQAWIFGPNGSAVPYASTFPSWMPKAVIAYCWNARNNANNLKRPLRDDGLNKAWP